MTEIRRQLTLFIEDSYKNMENIQSQFNPAHFILIPAHVTLCRKDEIEPKEIIIERINSINLKEPIRIEFSGAERFADGKGVLIPAKGNNIEFRELRKAILGHSYPNKEHLPHITLMHPRNSTCTDKIFAKIQKLDQPSKLFFNTISLIEQSDGGKWKVVNEYNVINKDAVQNSAKAPV